MTFNLSISDVQNHPEDFLYIFANDTLINSLGRKAALIIRQKKANQTKIIMLCAQNAGVDVNEYYNALRQGFIDIYGLKPAEILVKLAEGETVAGKNWSEGVYGIGAISDTFSQQTADGYTVKVNPETGAFIVNGQESAFGAIARKGCPDGYGGFSYVDRDGNTYFSSYSKIKKQYYAATYTNKDGQKYNAGGSAVPSASSSDLWETILGFLDKLTNWILSLFAKDANTNSNPMTTANTAPSQFVDGFATQEAGLGTWGVALLGAFAVGTLLFGEGKKRKK